MSEAGCYIRERESFSWRWQCSGSVAWWKRSRRIGALIGLAGLWSSREMAGILTTAAVLAGIALSRVNVCEIMFHPMGKPSFASIAETMLDGDEHVVSIRIGTAAHAYPIRIISYHHMMWWMVFPSPLLIERFVTPVWCGGARWATWF